jgi:hypothetical protein
MFEKAPVAASLIPHRYTTGQSYKVKLTLMGMIYRFGLGSCRPDITKTAGVFCRDTTRSGGASSLICD